MAMIFSPRRQKTITAHPAPSRGNRFSRNMKGSTKRAGTFYIPDKASRPDFAIKP